jgi:hypothetical protein
MSHSAECRNHAAPTEGDTEVKAKDTVDFLPVFHLPRESWNDILQEIILNRPYEKNYQSARRHTPGTIIFIRNTPSLSKTRQGWACDVVVPGLQLFLVERFGR